MSDGRTRSQNKKPGRLMNAGVKLLFTLEYVNSKGDHIYGESKVRNRLKHDWEVEEVTRLLVGFQAKRSGVMGGWPALGL